MENNFSRHVERTLVIVAVIMGLFHLYTAFFGTLTAFWQRSIHLGLGMTLAYLAAMKKSRSALGRFFCLLACIAIVISVFYLLYNFNEFIHRFGQPNTADMIAGVIIIFFTLDFARRQTGNILSGIAVVFLIYALAGPYLPGILWHRGYTIPRIINQIALSTEGIFGIPLGVSANYIFLFILFGALLEVTGIGQFYIDLAIKSMGKSPGGPAKAAVVASSLFGTVSGSAVANVAGTGTVTIPLMRSIGYRSEFAGAVEAVASTGGQIMPPLMGAGAFIMSEILGIPYYQVALGALIPALVYYGSVFAGIHFHSVNQGLMGTDTSTLPSVKRMFLANGVYLLPLIVLIYFLIIARISVMKAAVYSVLVTMIIGLTKSKNSLSDLIGAFEKGARTALVVIASSSCAGIIVAVINLTGLGIKFSNVMLSFAGDNLLVVLLFLMFGSLLLGMGLPTTPAYLILAVLGAPTLIRLGVEPLAAHMFVFYFGCISMITPPVALAVYAATSIAGSEFWKTALIAVVLGMPAFIVPYMFVYNPSMLWIGGPLEIAIAGLTALLGAVVLGAGMAGWLLTKAKHYERLILVLAGFALIDPGTFTNILGFIGMAVVLFLQHIRRARLN